MDKRHGDTIISLNNGWSWVFAHDMSDEEIDYYFKSLVNVMDDEIRETVHSNFAPCTQREFLHEYEKEVWRKGFRKPLPSANGSNVKEYDIIVG